MAMPQPARPDLMKLTVLTAGFAWLAAQAWPPVVAGEVRLLPAFAGLVAAAGVLRLTSQMLTIAAAVIEGVSTWLPTGKAGTARWGGRRDIAPELSRRKQRKKGPFWGLAMDAQDTPLFIDYVSNAMTVAPAGSGKGVASVVPMGLSIRDSKVLCDLKGELVCILKKPLEARGERVRVLNPAGLFRERVGEGESFSPLDTIADDLHRPGGLLDVPGDLRELAAQLLPEPAGKESDHTYFREGSRRAIAMACLLEAMVEAYDATLSSVALLIENREAFEHHLRWVAGVDLDGKPLSGGPMPIAHTPWAHHHDPADLAEFTALIQAWATNWLALMSQADGKTFESFLSGAQQALAPFAFGRLAPAMRRSTFRMADLKDGQQATSLFIVADSSRMEVFKPWLGLMQWCAMTAIKRHPDHQRPVYFIMDEATNYRVHGLESLLTWGRGYGLRLHLIFQDLSAFERTYGKTALETLLSETEIKQFLPGQRSPKTLEMISKMLGEQSVMAASLSREDEGLREQMSEAGRPLMTPEEVRRASHGVLLVRKARPLRIEPVSYAAVHPWRSQADINPFHGKPYRKKVRLRL